MSSPEKKAFKNWFDADAAKSLARQVGAVARSFDQSRFVRLATRGLDQLEFIARVQQFSAALSGCLPSSVPSALKILRESLPETLPDCDAVTDGWLQWPIGQFIADRGTPYPAAAFPAMIELTKRFSSEFAVRPFVEQQAQETFARLLKLTGDPDPHVRRWCSEGVRPRLPWGKKLRALVADPSPIWPILEALKDDPELYVRRSVANNLNDIAKDHPELVVRRCKAWSRRSNPERDWVIKHGLRSLVKDGHAGALQLIGYAPPEGLSVVLDIATEEVSLGGVAELRAQLDNRSRKAQRVMVDYALHYVRQGGKTSAKVFKWKSAEIPAGETLRFEKRHAMKRTTTRALYAGVHRVEVQVNGVRLAEAEFEFLG